MLFKKIALGISAFVFLNFVFSCGKSGGVAPNSSLAPELLSISISPDNQYVARQSSFKLTARGNYSDGSTADISSQVSWNVDDTSISSISSSGLLTNTWAGGLNNATRILNVSAQFNSLSDSTQVTIVSAQISSLMINPTNMTVAPNNSVSYTVVANMSDGSTLDVTNSVSISFSNPAAAAVNAGSVQGLAVGSGNLVVNYGAYSANTTVTVSNGASSGGSNSGTGLKGDYYDGRNFDSFFGTRTDATINFNWNSDVNNLGQSDEFSIRWTGFIEAEKSETYTFYTQADDGTRLSINGVPFASCINDWTLHAVQERTCATTFNLTAGQKVAVTLEYFEGPGVSTVRLLWSSPTTTKVVIPQRFLYPQ